ncbi:MAG: bacteriorhodopsin-like [Kofleriaceae bacterium]
MPTLSSFQYDLIYNLMSFTVAAMGAAAVFFFLSPGVERRFKPALVVSGLVVMIACYHYARILGSFSSAYTASGGIYVASSVPFNDFYRYADWLLTVPLLMVELVAVLALAKAQASGLLKRLVIAAALMIALGYPGEAAIGTGSNAAVWAWFAASMIPFIYIIATLFGALRKAAETQSPQVQSLIALARRVVLVTWSFYPIAYILGAVGASSGAGETAIQIGYTIADITAKAGFGLVIYAIARAKSAEPVPATLVANQA